MLTRVESHQNRSILTLQSKKTNQIRKFGSHLTRLASVSKANPFVSPSQIRIGPTEIIKRTHFDPDVERVSNKVPGYLVV